MLKAVKQLNYTIILCDDMELMKAFYRDLFPFPIRGDGETGLGFEIGATQFSLRKRTRHYDGQGTRNDLPGVQIAFRVEPDEVQECHASHQILDANYHRIPVGVDWEDAV